MTRRRRVDLCEQQKQPQPNPRMAPHCNNGGGRIAGPLFPEGHEGNTAETSYPKPEADHEWSTQKEIAMTNRNDVAKAIEAAIEQAELVYQFSLGNSYAAAVLAACLQAREAYQREAARKARKRHAQRDKRRKHGVKPRAEYEAAALAHGKPWEAAGVSKTTWYRRQHHD